MPDYDLIVAGGGAAGFFGAIQAAELHRGLSVLILEKSSKLLSKVRISGGGRCNATHKCFDPIRLSRHYPRGEKSLRPVFKTFNARHTVDWFAARGVALKVEEDGRMFPESNDSSTIVNCFLTHARLLGIGIETATGVREIVSRGSSFDVETTSGKKYSCSQVLIATGGNARDDAYGFIGRIGHTIKPPIPSLFTFNDSSKQFADLMGVSVSAAEVRIASSHFKQEGAVLITHWGLSGPAVIRLSAWAAEYLHGAGYSFTCLVSWVGAISEEKLRHLLNEQKSARARQKISSNPLFNLPQRLWVRLCDLAGIPTDKIWGELSNRHCNKLLENLLRCPFEIKGKTTFKEEFVTCGGVDLNEIDLATMESKKVKGIFFAGEVLNIDGETGGFNFQAAWSTAFIAATGFRDGSRNPKLSPQ
jgi:predicted Rossmann fold flavoprotein